MRNGSHSMRFLGFIYPYFLAVSTDEEYGRHQFGVTLAQIKAMTSRGVM